MLHITQSKQLLQNSVANDKAKFLNNYALFTATPDTRAVVDVVHSTVVHL